MSETHALADDVPRGVLFLAHPVAGDVHANVARARRWLRWARTVAFRDYEVIAPWLENLALGDDDADAIVREYNLRKSERTAARCDAILLVGGRVSEGMRREARACSSNSRPFAKQGLVVDLSVLGEEPPDEIWLRLRARQIFAAAKPERVDFYIYVDHRTLLEHVT